MPVLPDRDRVRDLNGVQLDGAEGGIVRLGIYTLEEGLVLSRQLAGTAFSCQAACQ
jgi:hypothetical protein